MKDHSNTIRTLLSRIKRRQVSARVLAIGLFAASTITAHAQSAEPSSQNTSLASAQTIVDNRSGTFTFVGRSFEGERFSGVTGVSSETAYLAVLDGHVRMSDFTVKPGEMLVIPAYQGDPSIHMYDAERLRDGLKQNGHAFSPSIAQQFDRLVRRQGWRVFVGYYGRTRFNVAAPGSAQGELARRSVIGNETVQSLRFSGPDDPSDLAKVVVDKFSAALKSGDAETLANLMDPTVFGFSDLREGGAAARQLYAQALIDDRDWPVLLTGRDFNSTDDPTRWQLQAAESQITLRLKPLDDFIFVSISEEAQ